MPLSPDLREALCGDGVPLGEAFRMHISEDAELADLIAHCDGLIFDHEYICECSGTHLGLLTQTNSMWPPSIRDFDLVSEWLDADGKILGRRSPANKRAFFDELASHGPGPAQYYASARLAEARLKLLYADLLTSLQTGIVIARGHWITADERSDIPRAVWSSEGTRISFTLNQLDRHAGDVIEHTGTGPPVRIERTLPDWMWVELAWRDDPGGPAVERDTGGRPPKYDWESAYDELMCVLAVRGLPGTYIKDDLGKLFQSAFESLDLTVPDLKQANAWLSNRNRKLWLMMKPARE